MGPSAPASRRDAPPAARHRPPAAVLETQRRHAAPTSRYYTDAVTEACPDCRAGSEHGDAASRAARPGGTARGAALRLSAGRRPSSFPSMTAASTSSSRRSSSARSMTSSGRLAEARRVLVEGGRLLYLEHIAQQLGPASGAGRTWLAEALGMHRRAAAIPTVATDQATRRAPGSGSTAWSATSSPKRTARQVRS